MLTNGSYCKLVFKELKKAKRNISAGMSTNRGMRSKLQSIHIRCMYTPERGYMDSRYRMFVIISDKLWGNTEFDKISTFP